MSHTVSAPILVTGAGGQIGSVSARIVEQLLKHGEQVRAFVRTDDARADRLRGLGAETFVGDLFETCRVIAPRTWELGPVADAILVGDEAMLRGAILNLVDNAIRATAESGTIELSAAAVDGSNIAITVYCRSPISPYLPIINMKQRR